MNYIFFCQAEGDSGPAVCDGDPDQIHFLCCYYRRKDAGAHHFKQASTAQYYINIRHLIIHSVHPVLKNQLQLDCCFIQTLETTANLLWSSKKYLLQIICSSGWGKARSMQCKLTEMGVASRTTKNQKQNTRSRHSQYIIKTNLICIVIQDISGQFCPHIFKLRYLPN